METKEEKVFYQDENVTVTQARFVSQTKTYAMRNISSVSIFHIRKSRFIQVLLIIVGGLCLLAEGSRLIGIVLVLAGILFLYLTKDDYSVRINSNSGEADGYISNDKELIQQIVDAVNEAIIYRG